jgi:hypothetical protein
LTITLRAAFREPEMREFYLDWDATTAKAVAYLRSVATTHGDLRAAPEHRAIRLSTGYVRINFSYWIHDSVVGSFNNP